MPVPLPAPVLSSRLGWAFDRPGDIGPVELARLIVHARIGGGVDSTLEHAYTSRATDVAAVAARTSGAELACGDLSLSASKLVGLPFYRCMNKAIATFGAGCFWGVEAAFRQLPGVLEAVSGYAGGTAENPSYEQVCTGRTGHAEVVQVTYDADVLPYRQLLDLFWRMHDPTTLNAQGPDIGTQYRSAIFYSTPEQAQEAHESKTALETSGTFRRPIVTQIEAATRFYPAEEYHQRYHEKHGVSCHINV